jgi:hypothetical protein
VNRNEAIEVNGPSSILLFLRGKLTELDDALQSGPSFVTALWPAPMFA